MDAPVNIPRGSIFEVEDTTMKRLKLEGRMEIICAHVSDGLQYMSYPPKLKCKKCGEFYDMTRDPLNRRSELDMGSVEITPDDLQELEHGKYDPASKNAPEFGIIDELFTYHPPTPNQIPRYQAIRDSAKDFAKTVMAACPPSADRTAAIRKIREAVMTANASIALDGKNV